MAYINTGNYRHTTLKVKVLTNGVPSEKAFLLLDGFTSAVNGKAYPALTSEALQRMPLAQYQERLDYFLRHIGPQVHAEYVHAAAEANNPYGSVTDADAPKGVSCPVGEVVGQEPPAGEAPVFTVACNAQAVYNGGLSYPHISEVTLGEELGWVELVAHAYSVPDRWEVWFDGQLVIDTGYIGSVSSLEELNLRLAEMGEPAVSSVTKYETYGNRFWFEKKTPTTKATVKVYAPLDGTKWDYVIACPRI